MDAPTGAAVRTQDCSRCGASLDVSGSAPGAWLACPGCGNPVAVRARPIVRPAAPPVPAPESVAWASDPRLVAEPLPLTLDVPEPKRRRVRKAGWMPLVVLAMVAGAANVMFVGTFIGPPGTTETILTWGFGFALALFVSAMTRSIQGRNLERVE